MMVTVPSNGAELFGDGKVSLVKDDGFVKVDTIPINLIEGHIEGSSPGMSCQYLMEVRQNGKKYQEDSCSVFSWNQTRTNNSKMGQPK